MRANYDALRVEMARMDSSMQDAADASSFSAERRGGAGADGGGDGATTDKNAGGVAARIGEEVGGAVGGIFRGQFWPGWGSGSGRGGGAEGRGRGAGGGGGGGGGVVATEKGTTGRREKIKTAGAASPTGPQAANRRGRGDAQGTGGEESFSRVRDNIMARLQEVSSQQQPILRAEGQDVPDATGNDIATDTDKGVVDGAKSPNGEGLSPRGNDKRATTAPDAEAVKGGGIGDEGIMGASEDSGGGRVGTAEDEWIEETVEHPAPDYGLGSPVIR